MARRGDDGLPVGYGRSLVDLLAGLRFQAGNPSFREIARRIPSAAGRNTSPGYISEVLRGRRVPSGDMAVAIVQALRGDRKSQERARHYAEEAASDKPRLPAKPGRQEPTVPRQLPAALTHFAGRRAELAALSSLLGKCINSGGTVVCAVSGTAGVGKTALAVHWAHQVADQFPDGQLYVNLRGFDPGGQVMAAAEAIRRLLDALQVPPDRIPVNLDDQAALYRTQLAGKRMLVVLDNARDTAQVRPLVPGRPGCLVLVTSRNQLTGLIAGDGAHPITLDLLTDEEAGQLLAWRLGVDRVAAEPVAVREIITRCAHLPLALALVAARAAVQPRVPLQQLAEQLRDAAHRWQLLTGDDPSTDVRAVLSWSYQALAPPAAQLFRLLGLHPGPDITAVAAASLAGVPVSTIWPVLTELTQASLLDEHTTGRYSLHDLLRTYANDLAQRIDGDPQRHAATHRVLDHYLHTAHLAAGLLEPTRDPSPLAAPAPGVTPLHPAGYQQAQDWFTAERPVLLAAVEHATATGFDTHAGQLVWTLVTFLDRQGHWHDLATASRSAVAAAQRRADPTEQSRAHRMLANAYTRMGRLDDAHTEFSHALDLTTQAGDKAAQAHTHLNLSYLWEQRSNRPHALDHARQALGLYRAAGHRHGQANALNTIGWNLAHLGDPQQAVTCCEHALTIFQELGDAGGQANPWDSLGYAHLQLGDLVKALTCYQHALALFRDLGDRFYEADTLSNIGDVYRAMGDLQAARDAWLPALTVLDDLGHPDADKVRAKLADLP